MEAEAAQRCQHEAKIFGRPTSIAVHPQTCRSEALKDLYNILGETMYRDRHFCCFHDGLGSDRDLETDRSRRSRREAEEEKEKKTKKKKKQKRSRRIIRIRRRRIIRR